MNKLVNKFMPEIHLKYPLRLASFVLLTLHVGSLLRTKNLLKSFCKQVVLVMFIRMNYIKLVYSLIWFIVVVKTELGRVLRNKTAAITSKPKYDVYTSSLQTNYTNQLLESLK